MLEASRCFFGDGHRSLVAEFNDSRQLQEDVRRCKGVKHGRVGGGLLEQTVTINKHRFMNLFLILFYWFKYFSLFPSFCDLFLKTFASFSKNQRFSAAFRGQKRKNLATSSRLDFLFFARY